MTFELVVELADVSNIKRVLWKVAVASICFRELRFDFIDEYRCKASLFKTQ